VKTRVTILLAACLVAFSGCPHPKQPTYVRWTKSRRTRMLAFKNIETLGVAPVIDETDAAELDSDALARAFASEFSGYKRFRVVYPKAVAAALAKQGIADAAKLPEARLLEATRAAKLDALLVIRVEDFKPYYPPMISYKVRLYATEIHGGLSAAEILEWSDDGVPRDVPAALTDRFIWARDEIVDAHSRSVSERVRLYSMRRDPARHPMGPEIFLRSMDRFFGFLADLTGRELYRDSLLYRKIAAERERRRRAAEDGYPIIMP